MSSIWGSTFFKVKAYWVVIVFEKNILSMFVLKFVYTVNLLALFSLTFVVLVIV